ncbi:MAG: thioredoxin family protein [Planctomycetes bacterium]|nr:thioredoxin family protein [Planctomycetota bacterium]
MALTPSTMAPLGSKAPDFSLQDPDGKVVSLADFQDAPALLVMFICNHCPYVIHIRDALAPFARKYQKKGVAIVGINSNDFTQAQYKEDRPERMKEVAARAGFTFPYLIDRTQEVAKAYTAACTPDFFLYDRNRTLVYRGQFDDSRPESGVPVSGKSLAQAIDALLAGKSVPQDQRPSMGCNIKWKPGEAPPYFG